MHSMHSTVSSYLNSIKVRDKVTFCLIIHFFLLAILFIVQFTVLTRIPYNLGGRLINVLMYADDSVLITEIGLSL